VEKRLEGMSNTITLAKQEKAASCACCRLTRKTQTQTCFLAHLNSDQKNERDQGQRKQLEENKMSMISSTCYEYCFLSFAMASALATPSGTLKFVQDVFC
jgi:hypothetical protein